MTRPAAWRHGPCHRGTRTGTTGWSLAEDEDCNQAWLCQVLHVARPDGRGNPFALGTCRPSTNPCTLPGTSVGTSVGTTVGTTVRSTLGSTVRTTLRTRSFWNSGASVQVRTDGYAVRAADTSSSEGERGILSLRAAQGGAWS